MSESRAQSREGVAGGIARLALSNRKLIGITAGVLLVYTLAGFLLAPWLLQKYAVQSAADVLGAQLRLESVAINPFVLSLEVTGLELDQPDGGSFARIEELFVNFQLSSLFRWALTFDELRITSPRLYLSRDEQGAVNVWQFVAAAADDEPVALPAEPGTGPTRLLVFDFNVEDAQIEWLDQAPPEPVKTRFGPVTIRIADLNTLPQRDGRQEVVINTETQGLLTWSGSLGLNPLRSVGRASITGSHFPLTSAYMKHQSGLDVVDGTADVGFDYDLGRAEDGSITAVVENLAVEFRDVVVKTFPGGGDGSGAQGREMLSVPSLRIEGGSLRWPEREAHLDAFAIDDASISLLRNAEGNLDVARAGAGADQPQEVGSSVVDEDVGDEWQLSLDRFSITELSVDLIDLSTDPVAESGLEVDSLVILDLSNAPGARFPTTMRLSAGRGGTVHLDGTITVLPAPVVELEVETENLAIEGANPYIRPVADISLDSGQLNLTGRLRHSPEEPLAFDADLEVTDFLITETEEGSRLGSWERLVVDRLAMSLGENRAEVSEVRVVKPYGDIRIGEDGSINLGRIGRGVRPTAAESPGSPPQEAADEATERQQAEAPAEPMSVTIGRILVEDGAAAFADLSLPIPFEADITELGGNISTVATASSEPSSLTLEGKVDEFGLVRVSGTITPFDPPQNTDLDIVFRNVEVPKLSSYTIPFAGREIADGRLDLELGYRLEGGTLVGENNILLRDFELGAEVPHPDAMSLPLGLAVALLKDPEGRIDIDLPVSGDVNDPEFSYGGVIAKALVNLVVKIATSPFNLLANLVGAEASDLQYMAFVPGRADLTPPEQEKAGLLAEALTQRPQLVVEIAGAADRAADPRALKAARLEALIEARIAARSDEVDAMMAEQRLAALEALYSEQPAPEGMALELDGIRAQFTAETRTDDGKVESRFDALAYANHLRDQLLAVQQVSQGELDALAAARAENARAAIVGADVALEGRVRVGASVEAVESEDEMVQMRIEVTAGGEE